MKKLLSTLLVIAMVVTCIGMFTACDKPDAGTDGGNEGGTTVPNANPNFKVGVLHIGDRASTSGYTYAHQQGILEMQKNLGLTDDQIVLVDNLKENKKDVKEAIDNLVDAGCQMIIGTSFGYMDPMLEAAQQYPEVIFSHGTGFKSNFDNTFIGADQTPAKNMNNYFGRIYQARYLSGIVAGLKAKELNNPKIGYVSAHGTNIAECSSGINAFALGAQAVYPEAQVSVKTLGEWFLPAVETSHAETLIQMGCGVIAQHCDTENPPTVASQHGAFSIGYNSDMRKAIKNAEKAESCLSSVIWHWGVYYTEAVKAAIKCFDEDGVFVNTNEWVKFGNYYGEYKDGLFGLAELSSKVAPETAEILALVEAEMKKGTDGWDVFTDKALSFTKGADNKYTMTIVDRVLKKADGTNVGEVKVSDITGNMPYWVQGVELK